MSKIYIKPSKRGSLRKAMGAKKGQKLSMSAMQAKKKNASPAMKKKLTFAINARSWHHEDGGLVNTAASTILSNKGKYSPTLIRKSQSLRNASKWKHEDGGLIQYQKGGVIKKLEYPGEYKDQNRPMDYLNFLHGYGAGYDIKESTIDLARLPVSSLKKFYGIELDTKGKKYANEYHEWLMNNGQRNLGIQYRDYGDTIPVTSGSFSQGGLTPGKATKILHDGTIRGRKITDRQRRYFGWVSNQKEDGGYVDYPASGNGGRLPEYGFGGTLASAGAVASMIPTPWTQIGGAALSMIGGIIGGNEEKKAVEEVRRKQAQSNAGISQSLISNPYQPTFPYGGVIPNMQPNVEVEGGEVIQGTDKSVAKVSGPAHAQGGVDLAMAGGGRVFSDKIINPDTGNTFAEDATILMRQLKKQR